MIEEPVNYITKVEIQGLFGRYDIVWNLHPDVNVLAGINGSGKSTILNIVHYFSFAFKNVNSKKFLYAANKVEISFSDNTAFYYDKYSIDFKPHYHSELFSVRPTLIRTFDTEVKPQELLEKADNEVKTELDWELWLLQQEYTKYQVRIYKYDSEINRATHKRFLAMIDELFSETRKKVNPDKEELEFLLGDKEINAYQLSSGEKQLLVILLTVLVQDNKPSILLMDEPEISLHMKWQRKLISYIRELNPNVQLIIATHSPDIIMDGWLDKVFNMCDIAKDSQ